MPEGEKYWGCQYIVIGGDNLLSPVEMGLTDLPNIGGPVAPWPPCSGMTGVVHDLYFMKTRYFT